MKNQWRLLLLRRHSSLSVRPIISRPPIYFHRYGNQVCTSLPPPATLPSLYYVYPKTLLMLRSFSSEPAASDHNVVIDIFSKPIAGNEIKQQLDSKNVVISHDLVLEVLKNVKSNPDVAIKFFDWVLERHSERLSSNSYNLMVGILGSSGFVKEFWDVVDSMRKMGYGLKKGAYDCVLDKFEKEGLESDLQRLKGLFDYRKPEDSAEVVSRKISKIVRSAVWGEDVESKIRDLGVGFSSDLVKMVVESLATEPTKALIFFRWVDESGLFKHDEQTYNAMAVILGREDCVDRFWNIVGEMRSAGYELLMETFVKVLDRFCKRKMMEDCVRLFEVAMMGSNKPSMQDCTFLLRKIAAAKEFDMDLFSRVVESVAESGNALPDSTVNAVLKSLSSVGRVEQSHKILDAMLANGIKPNTKVQGNIGFRLSRSGKSKEASEFIQNLEASGCKTDHYTWISIFRGHCLAGDLNKASECLQKSVEVDSVSAVGYDIEMLVDAYCCKGKAVEASKILSNLVKENGLKPRHTTYKMLISQLLSQRGGFKDALDLLDVMKSNGLPPYLDPFIKDVTSKRGTAQDALAFLKAVTVNKFPSTSVVLCVFEAYFKAGRPGEAQSLLAICPQYVRNNADVLNLFYDMNSQGAAKAADHVSAS